MEDIVFCSTDYSDIDDFVKLVFGEFEISMVSGLTMFLGLSVNQ